MRLQMTSNLMSVMELDIMNLQAEIEMNKQWKSLTCYWTAEHRKKMPYVTCLWNTSSHNR